MTRRTNARVAGFTFLIYIAVSLIGMVLFDRAAGAEGTAAKLAGIAQHASIVRVAIILELIGCILTLRDRLVPPTINYRVPDPECDLDYVTGGSRKYEGDRAMSNSFAFGGSNAVLVVGRHGPQ